LVARGEGDKSSRLNLDACKQHCIEHNFAGFCVFGGKAFFRGYLAKTHNIVHELRSVEGAVFYSSHPMVGTIVWQMHDGSDAFSGEDTDVKISYTRHSVVELAAEEVHRRLSGLVDTLHSEFFDDFIGNHIEIPLYEALLHMMSEEPFGQGKDTLRSKLEEERVWMNIYNEPLRHPFLECPVAAAVLNQRLKETKASFHRVVTSAITEMKSFWMGELLAMLTAEVDIYLVDTCAERHDNKDGLRTYYNVVTMWLSRVLPVPSFEEIDSENSSPPEKVLQKASDVSLDMLRRKLVEHPPFQLSNYAEYTDVILTAMEVLFDEAAAGLTTQIELSILSQITGFDCGTDWLEIRAEDTEFHRGDLNAMKVRVKPHILFSRLRVIFARLTPTLEMLLSTTQGVPISGIGPAALARHRTLEVEIAELKKARDGLCAALDIPPDELDEIRRKMGDDIS
jgi:hypothetical protein